MPKIDSKVVSDCYYNKRLSLKMIVASLNISYTRLLSFMIENRMHRRTISEAGIVRFDRQGRKPFTRQFRRKMRVLQKLGGAKCVYCGCDEVRILEVNHKNGDGHHEKTYLWSGSGFYGAILSGKRKTDDLEVCCKVCNTMHYVKNGLGISGHTVVWRST